mgnify:CR=1 FL=1
MIQSASTSELQTEFLRRIAHKPYFEAAAHAFHFARADVLPRKARNRVAERRQRRDGERVELYACGIARDGGGAETVDKSLNAQIADRNETLLQNARNGYDRNTAQHRTGKQRRLFFCLDRL